MIIMNNFANYVILRTTYTVNTSNQPTHSLTSQLKFTTNQNATAKIEFIYWTAQAAKNNSLVVYFWLNN